MSPRLSPTRTLLLALICASATLPAAAVAPPGRKYVLSVGITAYRDKSLKGCVNDATGVRDLLVESFGFDRAGATLLANDMATRAGILRAIQRYVETDHAPRHPRHPAHWRQRRSHERAAQPPPGRILDQGGLRRIPDLHGQSAARGTGRPDHAARDARPGITSMEALE